MVFQDSYLFVSCEPEQLINRSYTGYVAHILCNHGECRFLFHEQEFILSAGNALISYAENIVDITQSENCQLRIVATHPEFHLQCVPQSNFGIQGSLDLYLNPIIELTPEEWKNLNNDFDQIAYRLQIDSPFKMDFMTNVVQLMFLDFFQPHSRQVKVKQISSQSANNMVRFIRMLHAKKYMEHREVAWYASELCMAPKYLTEVSVKTSGKPASYWINRFTAIEIQQRLKQRDTNISQVCDEFHFSSLPHFTRFVAQQLGRLPSDYK